MRDIKDVIDGRINKLELDRQMYIKNGFFDLESLVLERLEELKNIKKQFSDRNGNWK